MPRAGLSEDVVVTRGADLADEVGLEALTLAALASRLGVTVPSLYKHVEGLTGLRRGITILATRELGGALQDALADAGASSRPSPIHALAARYRAWALAHPGRYAATVRAASPDDREHVAASEEVLRLVLRVLAEDGLSGPDAIDAARALRASIHGFVTLESAGGFGVPRDVERSFERMVATLERGLVAPGPGRQGTGGSRGPAGY